MGVFAGNKHSFEEEQYGTVGHLMAQNKSLSDCIDYLSRMSDKEKLKINILKTMIGERDSYIQSMHDLLAYMINNEITDADRSTIAECLEKVRKRINNE